MVLGAVLHSKHRGVITEGNAALRAIVAFLRRSEWPMLRLGGLLRLMETRSGGASGGSGSGGSDIVETKGKGLSGAVELTVLRRSGESRNVDRTPPPIKI